MGVTNKVFTNNQPPALVDKDLNAIFGELINAITSSGQANNNNDYTQLGQAIMNYVMTGDFVTETQTSAANAYVVRNASGYRQANELKDGMALRFYVTHQNTGVSTLNAFGLGAKTLLNSDGNALQPYELVEGRIYNLAYLTSLDAWQIQKDTGGDELRIDPKVTNYIDNSANGGITFTNTVLTIPTGMVIYMSNGRNADHTLANKVVTTTAVQSHTIAGTENGTFFLTRSDTGVINLIQADYMFKQETQPTLDGFWLNTNENVWYNVVNGVATAIVIGVLAKVNITNGVITSIEDFTTLSLATQFDLSRVIYIMYTLSAFSGATGNYIKIPVKGWNNPLIIQWGEYTGYGNDTRTITLNLAYSQNFYGALISGGSLTGESNGYTFYVLGNTLSTFNSTYGNWGTANPSNVRRFWLSWGV